MVCVWSGSHFLFVCWKKRKKDDSILVPVKPTCGGEGFSSTYASKLTHTMGLFPGTNARVSTPFHCQSTLWDGLGTGQFAVLQTDPGHGLGVNVCQEQFPQGSLDVATLFWRVGVFSSMNMAILVPFGLRARERFQAHLIS